MSKKIKPRGSKKNLAESVKEIVDAIEAKLKQPDMKATVGDFIRLLQLQQELMEQDTREITVKWIESQNGEKSRET
ncbi:MAG: hypothetical protein JJE04_16445 [Acidobacteriia bacterium]|nr:hypothetical protein [Terriglobia bacterium]